MYRAADHPEISPHPRMQREARTVSAMIDISCSRLHGTPAGSLCAECAALLDYSLLRLSKCPFQQGKTACGSCRVHCYKPDMRERARAAMRTAGPRMPLRHPLLALLHWFDSFRKEPTRPGRPGRGAI
jgi:hypothetical protein